MPELIVREYTVYSFQELSEKAQEKAVTTQRQIEIENSSEWWHPTFLRFKDELKEIGIIAEDFEFEADYSSRRYGVVMLDAWVESPQTFLKHLSVDLEERASKIAVEDGITIDRSAIHLSEFPREEYQPDGIRALNKKLNDWMNNWSKKNAHLLEEEYGYLISDESIKRQFIELGIRFLANGTRFYG